MKETLLNLGNCIHVRLSVHNRIQSVCLCWWNWILLLSNSPTPTPFPVWKILKMGTSHSIVGRACVSSTEAQSLILSSPSLLRIFPPLSHSFSVLTNKATKRTKNNHNNFTNVCNEFFWHTVTSPKQHPYIMLRRAGRYLILASHDHENTVIEEKRLMCHHASCMQITAL